MSTLNEVIEKLEKTKALLYMVEHSGVIIDYKASGIETTDSAAHLFFMAQEMIESVITDTEHWKNAGGMIPIVYDQHSV